MCYFYNQLQQVNANSLAWVAVCEPALEGPCPLCILLAPTGDGHVNFKDFLTVMTDTRRFFCSVGEQGRAQGTQSWGGRGRWLVGGLGIPGCRMVTAATIPCLQNRMP